MKHTGYCKQFTVTLDDRLTSHGSLIGSMTQKWDQFKMLAKESVQSTLGMKKKVHQDWFDENNESIKNP